MVLVVVYHLWCGIGGVDTGVALVVLVVMVLGYGW